MTSQPNPRLVAAFKGFSLGAAGVVAMIGLIALIGWFFDQPAWRGLFLGATAWSPALALAALVGGSALALHPALRLPSAAKYVRLVSRFAAAGVVMMGGSFLAGHLLGGAPMEDWLVAQAGVSPDAAPVAKLPLHLALALILTGIGLLLLDWQTRRPNWPAHLLAGGSTVIAAVEFLEQTYLLTSGASGTAGQPLTLLSAAVILLLNAAILAVRPDQGMTVTLTDPTGSGLLARKLSLAALAIPMVLGWLEMEGELREFYDSPLGAALWVVATMTLFLTAIGWTAGAVRRLDAERFLAGTRMEQSEALYRAMMDSLPNCVFRKDLQGRFTFVNQPFARMLGRPAAEVLGKTDDDFFPPSLAEQYQADDHRVLKQGETVETVEESRGPEGKKINVQLVKTPVRDAEGNVTGLQGVLWDISARVAAEQAMLRERHLLYTLMDHFPDPIFFKDADSRFIRINKALARRFGLADPAEATGKTDFDFYAQEYALQTFTDERELMKTSEPILGKEERESRPDGGTTWLSTTKLPLRDAQGRTIGSFGISRDITERKHFVEQLQKSNEELGRSEAVLRKTMADLQKSHEDLKAAQAQLIQAEKLESVGTLAAGVAHEVKNPLATMMLGVDYLNRNLPVHTESISCVLGEMRDAISRADSIIRGLLDFSRSNELAKEPEDLNGVTEQSLQLVRHEVLKNSVEVRREYGEGLPLVGVDRNQMQQVLVNLFMNAIQAMAEGGRLTVRTRSVVLTETDREDGTVGGTRQAGRFWVGDTVVILEIDDTGPGIPSEYLAKIYDPFFTTKPAGVGTGLGLTVTKKIVETHDGAIDINNLPEGGARVSIMLKAHSKSANYVKETDLVGG